MTRITALPKAEDLTMSTDTFPPVIVWREAVRDDLRIAGPVAIAMLRNEQIVDSSVLLTAISAAGLLDDVTASNGNRDRELATLRVELIVVAGTSDRLDSLLENTLFAVGFTEETNKNEALHQLVALTGLVGALPTDSATRTRVNAVLAMEKAQIKRGVLKAEDAEELSSAAGLISDALDLDDGHPVHSLLALFIK